MTDVAGFCDTCGAQLDADAHFCRQCGTKAASKTQNDTSGKKETFDPAKDKLFRVYSTLNNFRYKDIFYDNLLVNWFMAGREVPPVPYEEEIENYSELSTSDRIHPENFVKERFILKEAELLKHYLARIEKIGAVIESCSLPVNATASGYRDFPPPYGIDFLILHTRKYYNLPFKVEGIFNINTADERIEGDDERITLVSGINVKEVQEYLKKKKK